ncbi:hypothetical protein CR105_09625 [Massilia eurypsychrophila]|uniref:DUF2782 domain-containing protein n=1 Tax=Massilia eurypsychrophila TaxID=1485217 RepID=A0A2G8THC1_9BURK|nr:hypothetical protein CR105_09625 [Massilia eurypsychrophila]
MGMLAQVGIAHAQQTANTPPPKMERIEEGSDIPATTITPKNRSRTNINEKREGGRITEVEVTSGKSTYTMKGTPPGSVAQTGDATGSTLRPPQWKVLEFDLSRKKQKDAEAADTGTADAPPPPPPKPGK